MTKSITNGPSTPHAEKVGTAVRIAAHLGDDGLTDLRSGLAVADFDTQDCARQQFDHRFATWDLRPWQRADAQAARVPTLASTAEESPSRAPPGPRSSRSSSAQDHRCGPAARSGARPLSTAACRECRLCPAPVGVRFYALRDGHVAPRIIWRERHDVTLGFPWPVRVAGSHDPLLA